MQYKKTHLINLTQTIIFICFFPQYMSAQEQITTEYYKDIYCFKKAPENKAKFIRTKTVSNDSTECITLKNAKKNIVIQKECFREGQPVGDWVEKDGTITNYDFEIKYGKIEENFTEYDIYKGETINPEKGEFKAPKFLSYEGNFKRFVADKVKYPSFARENNIQGKVKFQFVVASDGNISDISILDGNKALDKEIVILLQKSPKWLPATLDGNPIPVIINCSCNFLIFN